MAVDLGSFTEMRTSDAIAESPGGKERLEEAKIQQRMSGLPQRLRAETNIQQREGSLPRLKESLERDITSSSIKEKILKTSAKIGSIALDSFQLVDERIQGAIAGPLYELQDLSKKDVIQEAVLASLHGITGKRKVRFEDVLLSSLPEIKIGSVDVAGPISVIGGLGVSLGVGAKVVRAAQIALKGGSGTLKSIEKTYELAKQVKNASGKAIAKLFAGKVGATTIDPLLKIPLIGDPSRSKSLLQVVNDLPKGVMKKILSDSKTFEVVGEITKGGKLTLDTTAKNIWNLRKALDDLMTEGDFARGVTRIAKGKIKDAGNMLRQALSSVDKDVAPLMAQYSQYSRVFSKASEILTSKGRVVVNKAGSILKRQGEPGSQASLQEFASLFPRGAQMLKDIKILNRNRAVTAAAELAVKASVGAAIFSKFIRRPASEAFGPESRSGGGTG